jgi:hypothetical protein
MRRARVVLAFAVIAATLAPARAESPLPAAVNILGSVTSAARPVGNVLVIALNLNDFAATQTWSGTDGSFTLPPLRMGVYRVMAVKYGFAPATATIVPTKPDHRVNLKLENEKQAKRSANQEIWEIRGSLPPDILRDLDAVLSPPLESASLDVPRFRGEMVSMTGVEATQEQSARPSFAQTALGVQSRIGSNWQIGIKGNMQRFADPTTTSPMSSALAESSVMSMELRSSPTDAYRFNSTKSWWIYRDDINAAETREADVRAHNFEWEHGDSRVQVRYFAQDNLFRHSPVGSEMLEIAGNTPIVQTRRNDVGVQLRVTQQSVGNNEANVTRLADLSAAGSFEVVPALMLHYGVASRLALDGQEWAPRTGAEWKFAKNSSLIASATYKVGDERTAASRVVPTIVVWTEDSRILPRYSYSFGFVTGKDENNRLTAIATVSEIDAPLRVVFTDSFEQFWDGLYVESGDVRRDVRVAYRKEIGRRFAVDIATTAGSARHRADTPNKVYVIGDLQSTFTPTGTTLAISYREIQQPQSAGKPDYRSERVNVRMAQNLYLPIDMKLLLGIEVAHAENSPFLLESPVPEGTRKYIGGLAFNF